MSFENQETITIAFTGASGLAYGIRLLECLLQRKKRIYLLVSKAARAVAALELNLKLPIQSSKLTTFFVDYFKADPAQLVVFESQEWTAPIASGSHSAQAMVICPCSSGCLAAIANGLSNNLIERAADVMLKEKKPIIMVPRETPLSVIHLENMLKLARMNAVILPAAPGFYHHPQKISELIDFVVARILDHLKIDHTLISRWG